jgi:GDP-D-mannose dehydratase
MKVLMLYFKNKTTVITGASGFKGCHLSATLTKFGMKVYGFVRPNSHSAFNLHKLNQVKKITSVPIDIRAENVKFKVYPGE